MTAKKVRKQVYIEARQQRLLKQLAQETGDSESELICQAIDSYVRSVSYRPSLRVWEEELTFIDRLMQQSSLPG